MYIKKNQIHFVSVALSLASPVRSSLNWIEWKRHTAMYITSSLCAIYRLSESLFVSHTLSRGRTSFSVSFGRIDLVHTHRIGFGCARARVFRSSLSFDSIVDVCVNEVKYFFFILFFSFISFSIPIAFGKHNENELRALNTRQHYICSWTHRTIHAETHRQRQC